MNIKQFLGLKGSWKWACKQMDAGYIVKPKNITGAVKYKLDDEGQRRILWSFANQITYIMVWKSANIFLSDFEIEWELVDENIK